MFSRRLSLLALVYPLILVLAATTSPLTAQDAEPGAQEWLEATAFWLGWYVASLLWIPCGLLGLWIWKEHPRWRGFLQGVLAGSVFLLLVKVWGG